jgi:hypothetical protein
MTKAFICLYFALATSLAASSQVVSIQMDKKFVSVGEEIAFSITCLSEQDLEITVFTEGHLVNTQKATLGAEESKFHFPSNDCPAGNYFILVTGNGIHVESEFQVYKKK